MGLLSLFGGSRRADGAAPSLAEAPAGSPLVVQAVAVDDPVRSDRLAALGVVAGCTIVLRQRRPAFVIDVGETTLALDRDIARGIHVLPQG